MALFGDAQMTEMRALFAGLACRDNCQVDRVSVGNPDGLGSPGGSSSTVGTYKVDVTLPTAGEIAEYASQIGDLLTWLVSFPYGTDIRKNDVLSVKGRKMTVQATLDPDSYEAFTQVLASEIV
jgi:hypothetical protein